MTLFSGAEAFGRVPTTAPMEADLIRLRVEPCACGGLIRADRSAPMPAVQAHVRSAQHVRWWQRVRAEWQGEP